MKTNIILGVLALILLTGVCLYVSSLPSNVNPQEVPDIGVQTTRTLSGVVTAVDLEQMMVDGPAEITLQDETGSSYIVAVPSMGLPLCPAAEEIASVGAIAEGDQVVVSGYMNAEGAIVPCDDLEHYLQVYATVENTEYGYSFRYQKSPRGLMQSDDVVYSDYEYLSNLQLVDRAEAERGDQGLEGLPAINVRVFTNPENLSALDWVNQNPRESNVGLITSPMVVAIVGGVPGMHYVTDGLWPTDTYVIAQGEYIYMLSGAFPDQSSVIYKEFQSIVETFTF